MNLRKNIITMARRRKTGVTAGDVMQRTGKSRQSVSAALTELSNSNSLSKTSTYRKSPISGKMNSVYSYSR